VTERLRAPLAALAALLIGGELAARGVEVLTDVRGWLVSYVLLFLCFELLRARRRLLDAEAFLVGAAFGLVRDGVYAKTLQEGGFFLGVDALGALVALFDWGMVAVLSLHVADALLPRRDDAPAPGLGEQIAASALAAYAAVVYLFLTFTNRYRYERYLGQTWLLADILFAAAGGALLWRALRRSERDEEPERDGWLWVLSGFCVWLPGALTVQSVCGGWSDFVIGFLILLWSIFVGFLGWRLWVERQYVDREPRRVSFAALGVAAWRLVAAAVILGWLGPSTDNERSAGAFLIFIDLPTRLVFAWLFFASRLSV
jgi:hypothetical protein